MKKSRKKTFDLFATIGVILLSLYTLSLFFPFLWAFFASLKDSFDFSKNPFWPTKDMSYDNFVNAFRYMSVEVSGTQGTKTVLFVRLVLNSLVYAVGCGLCHTLAPCLAAYATSKYHFRFSNFLYGFVIVAMLLPSVGTLASEIQITKALGLFDSFFGMFVMRFSLLGSNFLIFYATFKSVSWEYAEAAMIDGASHFRVFSTIMLPLAKTAFGAVFMLAFITYWNEYTTPMVFLPSQPTLAYGLWYFRQNPDPRYSSVPMQLAACLISCIPIFLLFMLFKNRIMGNLTMGGLKG